MSTGTYLDRILPRTREDLEARRAALPLVEAQARLADTPPPLDFVGALSEDRLHLIAEVKRASPSKGPLAPDLDVRRIARTYVDNGATCISVLTDAPFFQGSLDDLAAVREETRANGAPILRKDFVIDPYQVYEARLYGADAVLLIAVCLTDAQLIELQGLAQSLGMAALVEVHDEEELFRALEARPQLIGINNRDLRTFVTDLATTHGLAPRIPERVRVVAESGVFTQADAQSMRAAGVDAILVGEALITAEDTAAKVRELSSVRASRLIGLETPLPAGPSSSMPPSSGLGTGGLPGMPGLFPPRFGP
jgi:indole-3-glycerol phosphate synthase